SKFIRYLEKPISRQHTVSGNDQGLLGSVGRGKIGRGKLHRKHISSVSDARKMKGPFEIVGRLHCIASNAFSLPNRSEPCFFAIWIEVASKAVGCKISGEMGGVRGRRRRITYSNIRISVTVFVLCGHFFHWQTAKMSHVDGVIGVGRIEDDSY